MIGEIGTGVVALALFGYFAKLSHQALPGFALPKAVAFGGIATSMILVLLMRADVLDGPGTRNVALVTFVVGFVAGLFLLGACWHANSKKGTSTR